jgi:phosphoribosylformylglycinamidine synthase
LTDDAPRYTRDGHPPRDRAERHAADLEPLAAQPPSVDDLLELLASPNIRSRRSVWRQYDHMNGTRTMVGPGEGDAAVLRVKGTQRALALSLDGPGRGAELDPRIAAASAVLEGALNVAVSGARPIGLTNCLNFGSPETPEGYWQLAEAVVGLTDACRALDIPIVSGNVSLYNETPAGPILPAPLVGMIGLLDDRSLAVPMRWTDGDEVWLLGAPGFEASALAGSQRATLRGVDGGRPRLDLAAAARLVDLLPRLAAARLLHGAHDVSLGGLWVALARMAIASGCGASAVLPATTLPGAALFGEQAARVIVAVAPAAVEALRTEAAAARVEAMHLGRAGGQRLELLIGDAQLDVALDRLAEAHEAPFPR